MKPSSLAVIVLLAALTNLGIYCAQHAEAPDAFSYALSPDTSANVHMEKATRTDRAGKGQSSRVKASQLKPLPPTSPTSKESLALAPSHQRSESPSPRAKAGAQLTGTAHQLHPAALQRGMAPGASAYSSLSHHASGIISGSAALPGEALGRAGHTAAVPTRFSGVHTTAPSVSANSPIAAVAPIVPPTLSSTKAQAQSPATLAIGSQAASPQPVGSTSTVALTVGSGTSGDGYIAPGVNTSSITNSERFFDNGKGYYWNTDNLKDRVTELNQQTGNWDFFGDLKSRLPQPTTTDNFYHNLLDDANTCWYNVGSNIIQYWQSYYGIFYQGNGDNGKDSTLPYGYTYDKQYLTQLGGTQSLKVDMLFYDNWENTGGNLTMSAGWYLEGDNSDSDLKTNHSATAGFFKEFFDSESSSYTVIYKEEGLSKDEILSLLIDGFDLSNHGDGSFTQNSYGQIVEVDIGHIDDDGTRSGHAITCYGFTLDEMGRLQSLQITNSDDWTYGIETVYLKTESDGKVYLYTDQACTTKWTYADQDWYIDQMGYINTPDSLKNMYAQYSSKENPLVWNGSKSDQVWSESAAQDATLDTLPTESTGWDVHVTEGSFTGYYHSYYQTERAVEFNDHSTSGTVKVDGTVRVPELILSANTTAYTFSSKEASQPGKIEATALTQSGNSVSTFSGITVQATNTAVTAGTLSIASGAALTGTTASVARGGTFALAGGSAAISTMTVNALGTFSVTSPSSFTGSLTLEADSTLSFTLSSSAISTAMLSFSGSLVLDGSVELNINGSLTSGSAYKLITFTSGTPSASDWINSFYGYDGTLSLSGNTLVLNYTAPGSQSWNSGRGTWSATSWNNTTTGAENNVVTFTSQNTPATVTVQGSVTPNAITFEGGEYTLLAGSGARISGTRDVTLLNDARVTTGLNFEGRQVELKGTSSLVYNIAGTHSEIKSLTMTDGTTVTFQGNGSTYKLLATKGLYGTINVADAATLQFAFGTNLTLGGAITTTETSRLVFSNASADQDITYTLSSGTAGIQGNIQISEASDTRATTLRISGDTAASYNLGAQGILSLNEAGTFSGSVEGSGTVTVERGAQYTFATPSPSNKLSLSADTELLIKGTVSAGAPGRYDGLLGSDATITIAQGGTLVAYMDKAQSRDQNISQLSTLALDGGTARIMLGVNGSTTASPIARIETLQVSTHGGTFAINDNNESNSDYYGFVIVDVGQLSSSSADGKAGALAFSSNDGWISPYILRIDGTSADYQGDLSISTVSGTSSASGSVFNSALVELKSGSLGKVTLSQSGGSDDNRTGFGIAGDIRTAGVEGDAKSYLYSGSVIPKTNASFGSAQDGSGIASNIKAASHTLTIDSDEDRTFSGMVLKGTATGSDSGAALSIIKKGSGTQSFSGSNTGLQGGSFRVEEGKLAIAGDLNATHIALAGTASEMEITGMLNAAEIALDAGTVLTGGDKASVTGKLTVNAIASGANLLSSDTSATLSANLDLSGAVLHMSGTLDLDNHTLTFGSDTLATVLFGSWVSEELGETVTLTLFTGVSTLNFGGVDLTSGVEYDASNYLTGDLITDSTKLVYENNAVTLVGVATIPEPATATLSLLALAALMMRRKRR